MRMLGAGPLISLETESGKESVGRYLSMRAKIE
jgi:hypothetical protein